MSISDMAKQTVYLANRSAGKDLQQLSRKLGRQRCCAAHDHTNAREIKCFHCRMLKNAVTIGVMVKLKQLTLHISTTCGGTTLRYHDHIIEGVIGHRMGT